MMIDWRRFIVGVVVISLSIPAFSRISAQTEIAPCGYMDQFDLPVPNIDLQRNDFGIYRAQWGGLHTGIDVALVGWATRCGRQHADS